MGKDYRVPTVEMETHCWATALVQEEVEAGVKRNGEQMGMVGLSKAWFLIGQGKGQGGRGAKFPGMQGQGAVRSSHLRLLFYSLIYLDSYT